MAKKLVTSIDEKRIDNEAGYDGFYAAGTNLEDYVSDIKTSPPAGNTPAQQACPM